jgi:hypothetical protein
MDKPMRKLVLALFVLLAPLAAPAHVGNPDVYYDGYAGPYHLLVILRPPLVVPGVAQIEIRSTGNDVDQIKILPLRIIGPGAKMAPLPDLTQRSRSRRKDKKGKLNLRCLCLRSLPVHRPCMQVWASCWHVWGWRSRRG